MSRRQRQCTFLQKNPTLSGVHNAAELRHHRVFMSFRFRRRYFSVQIGSKRRFRCAISLVQNSIAKHSLGSKDCGLDRWQLFTKSERNFGIGHLPIVVQYKQDPIVSRQTTQLLLHVVLLFATEYSRKRRKGQVVW